MKVRPGPTDKSSNGGFNQNAYGLAMSGNGGNPSDAISFTGSEIPRIESGFTPNKPGTSIEKSRATHQFGARSSDVNTINKILNKPESGIKYGSITIKNRQYAKDTSTKCSL